MYKSKSPQRFVVGFSVILFGYTLKYISDCYITVYFV